MSLEDRLRDALKEALKEKRKAELSVLRLVLSEIHNERIKKGKDLNEEEIIATIRRQIRKRKEAIEQFRQGGREDLASAEEKGMEYLSSFLPPSIPEGELISMIDNTIRDLEATGPKDFGRVMKSVMEQTKGRAEGGLVNRLVKERLSRR